jgi:hypothetical protein
MVLLCKTLLFVDILGVSYCGLRFGAESSSAQYYTHCKWSCDWNGHLQLLCIGIFKWVLGFSCSIRNSQQLGRKWQGSLSESGVWRWLEKILCCSLRSVQSRYQWAAFPLETNQGPLLPTSFRFWQKLFPQGGLCTKLDFLLVVTGS